MKMCSTGLLTAGDNHLNKVYRKSLLDFSTIPGNCSNCFLECLWGDAVAYVSTKAELVVNETCCQSFLHLAVIFTLKLISEYRSVEPQLNYTVNITLLSWFWVSDKHLPQHCADLPIHYVPTAALQHSLAVEQCGAF